MSSIFKKLTKKKLRINGRNHKGIITVRHRGGGCKKRFRIVDFFFSFLNVPGVLLNVEKDPNRSSFIGLILYKNGFFSYILLANGLKKGSFVKNITSITNIDDFILGYSLKLKFLKPGDLIHNIEKYPGKGSCLCRASGAFGIVSSQLNFSKIFVIIKLKSGEEYLLNKDCFSSLGVVSNLNFKSKILKKAGTKRNLGIRPTVRGVAMNPIDHPHGGGEGKTSGGRISVTAWGKLTKGKRTRLKSKNSKFIYKSRFLKEKVLDGSSR